MADNFTLIEGAGAYYTQDFSLSTLNILTAAGQRFEMRKLLVELSYYEDLYSFVVSGYITLKDSQGFLESLQLTGNEFIEINFGKIKNSPNTNDQIFRMYKVGNRAQTGNMNTEYYTLYFCSEELLLSEQIKISKSYNGQNISDTITSIVTDKLKINSNIKPLNIEKTVGVYNFIVPKMKPFEAISWLSTYARPKETGLIGADMLFFETKDGFNFRSLQSMMKDPVYATYKYQQTNLDSSIQSFQNKTISVLNFEYVKTYDMLKDINSGTYANRLISLDPIARKKTVTDFDYTKYKSNPNINTLDGNGVLVKSKNRFGISQNEAYDSKLKVVTGNSSQKDVAYIKQIPGSVANDIAIENYVPLRTAQISLSNYIVLKLTIPGDSGITVGRTINFDLMTIKPSNTKDLDKFYSGKYLVTAVRHIIQSQGVYQTVLEIAKDSTPTQFNNINTESSEWKVVVKD
jgi:hypothetical protein